MAAGCSGNTRRARGRKIGSGMLLDRQLRARAKMQHARDFGSNQLYN